MRRVRISFRLHNHFGLRDSVRAIYDEASGRFIGGAVAESEDQFVAFVTAYNNPLILSLGNGMPVYVTPILNEDDYVDHFLMSDIEYNQDSVRVANIKREWGEL